MMNLEKDKPRKSRFGSANNTLVYYIAVLVIAGVIYGVTCAPTVLWQDSGLLVYRILNHDIQGNLGIALAHPLYIIIGFITRLIPFGDPAYKINLISVVFGALTIANLYLLLRLLKVALCPALVGAASLALAWTFWQNAVIAEVYTLYTAILFLELVILLQFINTGKTAYLYLLGFLNGLSIANHLWGVFPLACYVVFMFVLLFHRRIVLKHLGIFILCWAAGAAPYEYLIIKNIIISGDVAGTLSSAVFGNGWCHSVLNASISGKIMLENCVFILLNFPTPNIILFFVGLWACWKTIPQKPLKYIIFALMVLFFIFAFRYKVPDRHAFFIPFYCIAAVFFSMGASYIFQRFKNKTLVVAVIIFSLFPIPAYFLTPAVARQYYKPLAMRRQRPYRDEYTYWLQPWKTGYDGAEKFAREALESVEADAVLYAYTTDVHCLFYIQQVYNVRPDVKIVSDHDCGPNAPVFNSETIDDLLREFPVYVSSKKQSYCPDFVRKNYDFVKKGILWQVVKK